MIEAIENILDAEERGLKTVVHTSCILYYCVALVNYLILFFIFSFYFMKHK